MTFAFAVLQDYQNHYIIISIIEDYIIVSISSETYSRLVFEREKNSQFNMIEREKDTSYAYVMQLSYARERHTRYILVCIFNWQ